MIKKFTLLNVLLVMSLSGQVKKFDVLFDKASSQLNKTASEKLSGEVKTLFNSAGAYTVICKGHTDNDGELVYNSTLSKNRSEQVKKQLVSMGFQPKNISLEWKGETEPVAENSDDVNMQKNRRVTIEIKPMEADLSKILGKEIKAEEFIFTNEKGGSFLSKSGTKISATENSFVFADGSVVNGDVKINYVEYRNVSDFLLGNISMNPVFAKEDFFNSGGMMKITAEQNGKEVQLSPGKKLNVDFALAQKGKFDVFYMDNDSSHWHTVNANSKSTQNKDSTLINSHSGTDFFIRGHSNSRCKMLYKSPDLEDTLKMPGYIDYTFRKLAQLKKEKRIIRKDCPWITFPWRKEVYEEPPYYKMEMVNRGKGIFKFVCPGKNNGLGKLSNYFFRFVNREHADEIKNVENINWQDIRFTQPKTDDNKIEILLSSNGNKKMLIARAYLRPNVQGKKHKLAFRFSQDWNSCFTAQERWMNYTDSLKKAEIYKIKIRDSVCFGAVDEFNIWADSAQIISTCYLNYNKMKKNVDSVESDNIFDNIFSASNEENLNSMLASTDPKELLAFTLTRIREKIRMLNVFQKERSSIETLKQMASVAQGKEKKELENLIELKEKQESAFKSFSIDQLGVWNCDQVDRMKEPIYVKASYRNETDHKLEFIKIFLVIDGLNGIIEYNGYNDLSPKHFALEKTKSQFILGIGTDLKLYHVSKSEVESAIKHDNSKTILFKCSEYKKGEKGDPLAAK